MQRIEEELHKLVAFFCDCLSQMVVDLCKGKGFVKWQCNLHLTSLQCIKEVLFGDHSDACHMLVSKANEHVQHLSIPNESRLPTTGEVCVPTVVPSNFCHGPLAMLRCKDSVSKRKIGPDIKATDNFIHLAMAGSHFTCTAPQRTNNRFGENIGGSPSLEDSP